MPRTSTRRPAAGSHAHTEFERLHFTFLIGAARASVFRKKPGR